MKKLLTIAFTASLLLILVICADAETIKGDYNNDSQVTLTDAMHCFIQVAKGGETTAEERYALDVNYDEKISIDDAVIMLRYIAGKRESPVDLSFTESYENASVATVSSTPNKFELHGFGLEFDPHFFADYNSTLDETDWQLIESRAKELGVQTFRIMAVPSYFEQNNDNDDSAVIDWDNINFNTKQMYSMYRILDLAEELNIKVNITIFCVDVYWLANGGHDGWGQSPTDAKEFAEMASILMQHLIFQKGYDCITDFTVDNEGWSWNGMSIELYTQMCNEVYTRFTADGLIDKLKIIMGEDQPKATWIKQVISNVGELCDYVNIHSYTYEGTTYNQMAAYISDIQKIVKDKPLIIDEFGGINIDAYHQISMDDYDRGLFYSQFVTAAMNNGVIGMKNWNFFDMFYYAGERKDALMQTGLFKYKDENWEIRPFYNAYGLIMRYTKPQSSVYAVETENKTTDGTVKRIKKINMTSFKTKANEWTYILTNADTESERKIKINNPNEFTKDMRIYTYSPENAVGATKLMENYEIASIVDNVMYITLQPNTFCVITAVK